MLAQRMLDQTMVPALEKSISAKTNWGMKSPRAYAARLAWTLFFAKQSHWKASFSQFHQHFPNVKKPCSFCYLHTTNIGARLLVAVGFGLMEMTNLFRKHPPRGHDFFVEKAVFRTYIFCRFSDEYAYLSGNGHHFGRPVKSRPTSRSF